nr:hypothetical protein [Helicobacteraceae bacterium]
MSEKSHEFTASKLYEIYIHHNTTMKSIASMVETTNYKANVEAIKSVNTMMETAGIKEIMRSVNSTASVHN